MMTTMSIHFCKYNGLPVVLLKAFIFQISNYLKRKGSYRNPEEINHAKAPFVPLNFHLKPLTMFPGFLFLSNVRHNLFSELLSSRILNCVWLKTFNIFRFMCPDCGKEFRSGPGYRQHRTMHTNTRVQCSVCTEKFLRFVRSIIFIYPSLPTPVFRNRIRVFSPIRIRS